MALTREEEIDRAWAAFRGDKLPTEPVEPQIPREEWLALRLQEQDGRCRYCKRRITPHHPDTDFRATIDHVIPRGKGGKDTYDNVTASCGPCNTIKGGNTVDDLLSDPKFRIRLHETEYYNL